MSEKKQRSWTTSKDGQSNSSDAFEAVVDDVARMLRDLRVGCDVRQNARGIVARLAHVHRLAPER
jgi:hypothetical protein